MSILCPSKSDFDRGCAAPAGCKTWALALSRKSAYWSVLWFLLATKVSRFLIIAILVYWQFLLENPRLVIASFLNILVSLKISLLIRTIKCRRILAIILPYRSNLLLIIGVLGICQRTTYPMLTSRHLIIQSNKPTSNLVTSSASPLLGVNISYNIL